MSNLKIERNKNMVTFFTLYKGTRVNVLTAKVNTSHDLPRLWTLAKGQLIEFTAQMSLKGN